MTLIQINKKKIILIVGYIIIITILYISTSKTTENFDVTPKPFTGKVIKSFGTVLKDNPKVAQKSLLFRAVTPTKRRKMPDNYPSNDIHSPIWKKYMILISEIGNQGQCGSCWAWSTVGMLADRFSLCTAGKIQTELSPAKMVMCTFKFADLNIKEEDEFLKQFWKSLDQRDPTSEKIFKDLKSTIACSGNDLYSSLQALFHLGTTPADCVPYISTEGDVQYNLGESSDPENIPHCLDVVGNDFGVCLNKKEAARIYRADDIYTISSDEDDIMQEIYRWGPVAAGFKVYEGFLNEYDGKTIYKGPKKDKNGNVIENPIGGHAVRIVGWGQDEKDGDTYWWIANSWSNKWGINGYFKMKRNIPECMLEQNVVALKPQLPGDVDWSPTLDLVTKIDNKIRNYPDHTIDDDLLYYESTIENIKQGKIKGDIDPIITKDQLPYKGDFKQFWAADILYGNFSINNISQESKSKNKKIAFIIATIIGIILILII